MRTLRAADPDRYLSMLYAPQDRRADLLALYAFNAEVAGIRDRVSEPMPGEIRLQWWRDVIAAPDPAVAAAGNPLAEAPTLIPALGDDPLTQAEHRRACRLLAAELIVPSRLVHDRRAAHRSLPSHRAPSPASSTAASAVAAAPLDRLW